jgi:aspartate/tyrosine/aromatic aminotransferase
MFSLLGLAPAAVAALASEQHVHTRPDVRINLAGVSLAKDERVAEAIVAVLDPD